MGLMCGPLVDSGLEDRSCKHIWFLGLISLDSYVCCLRGTFGNFKLARLSNGNGTNLDGSLHTCKQCIASRAYQLVRHVQNLYIRGNNVPLTYVQYKLIHERPSKKKEMFYCFLLKSMRVEQQMVFHCPKSQPLGYHYKFKYFLQSLYLFFIAKILKPHAWRRGCLHCQATLPEHHTYCNTVLCI